MHDIIINGIISHGRIFTACLSFLFIKFIPELLNIPYNDFAIISQCFLKIILYMILVLQFSNLIYKFVAKDTKKELLDSGMLLFILCY